MFYFSFVTVQFSSTTYQGDCLFSIVYSCLLCHRSQLPIGAWVYPWASYPAPLMNYDFKMLWTSESCAIESCVYLGDIFELISLICGTYLFLPGLFSLVFTHTMMSLSLHLPEWVKTECVSSLCLFSARSWIFATSVCCQEFCFSQISKRSERLGHTHPPCQLMPPLAQEPHSTPGECSLHSCCLCPQPVFLAVSSLCLFTWGFMFLTSTELIHPPFVVSLPF